MITLLTILIVIEPLVLVLIPAAVPYMWFQWRLSETKHQLEASRATKRRWTQYFVSALTDAGWVPEVIYAGFHYRHSVDDGARLGQRVAKQLLKRFFKPVKHHT
jgi:hypothetical protein